MTHRTDNYTNNHASQRVSVKKVREPLIGSYVKLSENKFEFIHSKECKCIECKQ